VSNDEKTFTLITHDDEGNPQEKTLSIKARTQWDKKPGDCTHSRVVVDESLWKVECEDCGEMLDPIHYLLGWARGERAEETRVSELKREYKRITDILEIKTRTRCEHCRKITAINTEGDIKKIGLLLRYVDTGKNRALNKGCRYGECGIDDQDCRRLDHEFYLMREVSGKKLYVCKYCGKAIWE
jgi:ribosomal protein S27E